MQMKSLDDIALDAWVRCTGERPSGGPEVIRAAIDQALEIAVPMVIERCALIVCPVPHVEEERRCQDIAVAIRATQAVLLEELKNE